MTLFQRQWECYVQPNPCSSDSANERILHHVLNTLFRLLHSYTIISNIFCHTQVLYEKAVLKSFKNSQEKTYAGVFLNRVACMLPASLLQIYLFLYTFSCEFCQISQVFCRTPPFCGLLLLNILLFIRSNTLLFNFSHKMLCSILVFFWFAFNILLLA